MLVIQNLIPLTLKERIEKTDSSVWNKHEQFNESEWIKITAPSGTGKTTLIHILYGLRNDYTGHVIWNDQDIRDFNSDELAKFRQQNTSVIFQDLKLFPELTARENIELKRVLQSPFCNKEYIDEMASRLGIINIMDQPAKICSYGEQQRIAIIRALVQPFKWLLMDEPFSHLDLVNQKNAAALIADECIKRKAGLIITDLDEDHLFNYTRKLHL